MKTSTATAALAFLAALAGAGTAQAIEFSALRLERPAGVAGLMFDDQFCFPEQWRTYETINQLGTETPRTLWLSPLTRFGEYVAAGTEPGVWVVAADLRRGLLEAPQDLRRTEVEYGRDQAQGFLDFLQCVADTDPAVFQRYLDIDRGLIVDVDGMIARLVGGDAALRDQLLPELTALGPSAVVPLSLVLVDPNLDNPDGLALRLAVIRTLGEIGPDAKDAAPFLVTLFGNERGTIRAAARQALTRIGSATVPFAMAMLSSADARIRLDAALVLGAIEPPPAEALAALQTAAVDADPGVRETAEAAAQRILGATARP